MNGITSSGAKGINALGPRYMGKYHPLMEIGPRYLLIQGTHRELTKGNGPPVVLDVAPMLVLFAIVMTFCILGCFLPSMPLLLICVPIFVPIAKVFGWDLIWFGVIITVLDNMASILSKSPGKAGGLKRGDRSKRFLLFAYGELQQLKLLHSPVLFFLISYVEPNFPLSHSYRAYEIASGPEALSCYFTNFSKASRDFNGAFPFQIAYYLRHPILGRNRQQHMHMIRT